MEAGGDDASIFAEITATSTVLGRGGFGVVRRGETAGGPVAVKTVDLAALSRRDPDCERTLVREIETMRGLAHPHVLRLRGWRRRGSALELALEFVAGPELAAVVGARGALDERAARAIGRQLIDAVRYLHARSVIHRDLKTENVMLAAEVPDLRRSPLGDPSIKVIDFGLARRLEAPRPPAAAAAAATPRSWTRAASRRFRRSISTVGTRGFAPPEIADAGAAPTVTMDDEHAFAIDAFAIGRVLRHVLTGVSPEKSIMEGLADQGVDCGCFVLGKVVRIVPPSALPRDAADLVARLSREDADDRLCLDDARHHAWFAAP